MIGMLGCVAGLAAAIAAEPVGTEPVGAAPDVPSETAPRQTESDAPPESGVPPVEAPGESAAPVVVAPPLPTPQDVLDDAISMYVQGKSSEARRRLQYLLGMGPDIPAGVRQKALAYLGEILFKPDDTRAALPVFEALLDEAPDYVMDPFEHPPDVCAFVEDLRASRRQVAVVPPKPPPPPATRGPFPIWSFAPGGVYYYVHKEPGMGIAVGGAQLAVFATNIVLWAHLSAIAPTAESDIAAQAEWNAWQTATNVTGALTIASLVLPAAVETSRWLSQPEGRPSASAGERRAGKLRANVQIAPGGVSVRGRF